MNQQLTDRLDLDNLSYNIIHANPEISSKARDIFKERKAEYETKYQEVYFYTNNRVGRN